MDNQVLTEGSEGWVSFLHRALEVRVSQLLGKEPRIWRDPKLRGNDFLEDGIFTRLFEVSILIAVITPRYLNSEWCLRELHEFLRLAETKSGLLTGEGTRFFKVVKTPVPLNEQPSELLEVLGYEFFSIDSERRRPRELMPGLDKESDRLYWAKLDDLAHDISSVLKTLGGTSVASETGLSVYLADTSFDLSEQRSAVRRELLEHGYQVRPSRPLPLVATECEQFIREELEQADLAVQLVGGSYGFIPDGTTDSVVALQNREAAEQSAARGLPRLVWIAPGVEELDPRQKLFVERLRNDPQAQTGADLLEFPLEDLKAFVVAELERRRRAASREPALPAAPQELPRVYLICDRRDREATRELADCLFEGGYEVILPVFDCDDEAEVRIDHQENLTLCDGVLVYYGGVDELWLRRKLRDLLKVAGYGRTKPLLARGIYLAPPITEAKRSFRTHEAVVMSQNDSFTSESLRPFLAVLDHARRRLPP